MLREVRLAHETAQSRELGAHRMRELAAVEIVEAVTRQALESLRKRGQFLYRPRCGQRIVPQERSAESRLGREFAPETSRVVDLAPSYRHAFPRVESRILEQACERQSRVRPRKRCLPARYRTGHG